MILLSHIRRTHAANGRGGPGGGDALLTADLLPAVEELADEVGDIDPDMDEAQALEVAAPGRRATLDTLEELPTDVEDI